MGDLHIAGFEIPVARDGMTHTPGGGQGGRTVTGSPDGSYLFETDDLSIATPLIRRTEAAAIESLCRPFNGHLWRGEDADGAQSLYSTAGLAVATGSVVTSTAQAKFGTRSFALSFGSIGNVPVVTVGTLYTVAAWVKPGAGAWQHEILRSDGAKWVDGTRNDAATLHIDISSSQLRMIEPGSGTDYFDDVTWLPFEIYADWAADWAARTRTFSPLRHLEISGDLLGGYRIDRATVTARVTHVGEASFGDSARVQLEVTGIARTEDV